MTSYSGASRTCPRGAITDAKNRIHGLEARRPDTIYSVDTLIAPPDSLPIIREITPGGRAQFELLMLQRDTIAYPPHLYDVNVASCDRGIVAGPTGLVCRGAPLGHLSVFARLGVGSQLRETPHPIGAAGVSRTPAFRSGWRVDVGIDLERRGYGVLSAASACKERRMMRITSGGISFSYGSAK